MTELNMSETRSIGLSSPATDRFIALARANGDAFVYQRADASTGKCRTVFVDGGYRIKDLEKELEKAIGAASIDVLIVTHGDDDHTRGAQYLLGSSRAVHEVWLPAVLAPALKDLIASPITAADKVFEAISDYPEQVASILRGIRGAPSSDLPDDGEQGAGVPTAKVSRDNYPRADQSPSPRDANGTFGDRVLDEWAEALGKPGRRVATSGDGTLNRVSKSAGGVRGLKGLPRLLREGRAGDGSELLARSGLSRSDLKQLVSGARRIVEIAAAAASRGHQCKVRWFDVQRFLEGHDPAGGDQNELVPLNAVEIHPENDDVVLPSLSRLSVPDSVAVFARLAYAFLSPSNAYGLVFEAPAVGMHPGVIFSGDSDFSQGRRSVTEVGWPPPRSSSPFSPAVEAAVVAWIGRQEVGWPHWQHWVIVTAPHHGSASNDKAYPILSGWFWPLSFFMVRGTSHRVETVSSYLRALPHVSTCDGSWETAKSRVVELVSQPLPCPRWVLRT